jgi:hypothetical protein
MCIYLYYSNEKFIVSLEISRIFGNFPLLKGKDVYAHSIVIINKAFHYFSRPIVYLKTNSDEKRALSKAGLCTATIREVSERQADRQIDRHTDRQREIDNFFSILTTYTSIKRNLQALSDPSKSSNLPDVSTKTVKYQCSCLVNRLPDEIVI